MEAARSTAACGKTTSGSEPQVPDHHPAAAPAHPHRGAPKGGCPPGHGGDARPKNEKKRAPCFVLFFPRGEMGRSKEWGPKQGDAPFVPFLALP